MRAHERAPARTFLVASAGGLGLKPLARLVAPEGERGREVRIVGLPRRHVAHHQRLAPAGDGGVVIGHARRQLLHERGAVACQLRSARHERLVDARDELGGCVVFQQAVLVAHHLLVVLLYDVVVRRELRAQRVERNALDRRRPLRQLQIVGCERHGGHKPLEIGCSLALAVQEIALLPLAHLERQRELAAAVGHVRVKAREIGALAHYLLEGGAAKRLQRREELDTLHHIRLSHGIRAHEHRQRPQG